MALLAGFLGCFGVHRFYLGKIFTGLAILLLATIGYVVGFFFTLSEVSIAVGMIGWSIFGIAYLWAIIDFVMAVTGAMKDKDGIPIKTW